MRKIDKLAAQEPESLKEWKRTNPTGRYKDLTDVERQDIRESCTKWQFYLCAYCCKSISGKNDDTMNEHVEARRIAPNRSLDITNIVASCTTPHQCDDSHGSRPLSLTPLMDECETELQFSLSGQVKGLSQRANDTINVLNLGDSLANNRSLIEQRKIAIQSLLFANGVDPEDGLEDDDLIEIVIDDLRTPKDGHLEAFSPVLVNVLRQWVQQ
ncbi:hypothetical protein MJ923_17580 [Shewanella sp. 3B26]|uniref:TIGR02646 family protein n=1 Tax=Shewanella zhuhaiensis TaxID=2919576 RepID=A0AAJ1BJT1_9GAMM|nr:hypothetical protein [Shewanella zhuhaiensis]MCH4296124.1 hypothetical protein [Shewanella zhuhaiensis]